MIFAEKPLLSQKNRIKTSDHGEELENFLFTVEQEILDVIHQNSTLKLLEMSQYHFAQRGKMIRPLFIREFALYWGLNEYEVMPWAVACEILHSATLVHDDIQDGDEVRRGQEALWKRYGLEQGINVGDFLLMIAPQPILNSRYDDRLKGQLLLLFSQFSAAIVNGQSLELDLNYKIKKHGLLEKYLDCISGKTAALFSGLAEGTGCIAKQPEWRRKEATSLFLKLGQLFQIQDDILDLFGDKKRGEVGCDIKEGKVSFLMAQHIDLYPEDFDFMVSILKLKRDQTLASHIVQVQERLVEKGTLQVALIELEERVGEILKSPFFSDQDQFNFMRKCVDKIIEPISHLLVKSRSSSE